MTNADASPQSIAFKPVAGGFVFQAPKQWVFGQARHYLANEEQRQQLIALLSYRRPVLVQVVAWTALIAMVTVAVLLVWVLSGHDNPTTMDVVAITAIVAIEAFAALQILFMWRLNRVRPLLAELMPTQEQITPREMQAAVIDTTSIKQLIFVTVASACACTVFAFSFVLALALDRSLFYNVMQLALTAVFAGVTWIWYRRLILKIEQRPMSN